MQRCLGCMREFGDAFDVCPHCGYIVGTEAASKNHLAPGTVLQDRYTLGKALGQGGFGITYIAWDNKIGRAVAIKEYMPNALASRMTGEKEISCYNEEARRQFELGLAKTRKEAHALSQFGALESVVKVHDCIEENGTAYIVMELLRGRTVKEIIAERGRLSFAQTMRIMTPVLETLDAMHGVGMIHRDVAPDNIFVCEDGKIKLLDFGAARVVSDTDEKTLSVMLKAGYAPVEQYSSRAKQGAFTDVYAASATMYKMLTGETPPDSFTRDKDGSDLKALTQTDAPPTAQETIRHGMALNAADRIGSARELLDALRKDAPENVAGIDPKQFLHEQKKKQTKKIARAVLAAALVVCVVAGMAFTVLHKRLDGPQVAQEQSAETTESSSAFVDSPYRVILEAYQKGIRTNYSPQEEYPEGGYVCNNAFGYNMTDLNYALIDLCEDGEPELFIAEGDGIQMNPNEAFILDVWGCFEGKAARLFGYNLGWRSSVTIHKDGTLYYDSGALYGEHTLYTVEKHSTNMTGYGVCADNDCVCYSYSTDFFQGDYFAGAYQANNFTVISQTEYEAFCAKIDNYEKMTDIQWIPFS